MNQPAAKTQRARRWATLLAYSLIGTLFWMIFFTVRLWFGDGQLRNLQASREHVRVLKPLLENDPRFAAVELSSNTAHNGSLRISGEVESQDAEAALRTIVLNSKPSVHVEYAVLVIPPEVKRIWEEKRPEKDERIPRGPKP